MLEQTQKEGLIVGLSCYVISTLPQGYMFVKDSISSIPMDKERVLTLKQTPANGGSANPLQDSLTLSFFPRAAERRMGKTPASEGRRMGRPAASEAGPALGRELRRTHAEDTQGACTGRSV